MKPALYHNKLEAKQVHCLLCPHDCIINMDKSGFCEVRKNIGGTLMALNYGRVSIINLNPIENLPLYHYYPGKQVLAVGSIGCNFHCSYCQTHTVSQVDPAKASTEMYTLYEIISQVEQREQVIGIAFTYNEPIVNFEFTLDIAKMSSDRGLKNILVTNAYINPGPLSELVPYIDAFCVDIKGCTEEQYKKIASAELMPVKEMLKYIARSGTHLELSYLIIPGVNDDDDLFVKMLLWIRNELGDQTVLHLTKYYPKYRLTIPATDNDDMIRMYNYATDILKYVYLRNMYSDVGKDTYCPYCGTMAIERIGFKINNYLTVGRCENCNAKVLSYYN